MPVRYFDQGSSLDGQNVSAVGRTWTKTALNPLATASSYQASSSARCWAGLSPVADGQSMLTTLALRRVGAADRVGFGGARTRRGAGGDDRRAEQGAGREGEEKGANPHDEILSGGPGR
jgi:hypothetical protein